MKTAVSIPNDIFRRAERLAKRLGMSRSELYGRALREFLGRHSAEEITAALDLVFGQEDARETAFTRQAVRRRLRQSDW